MLQSYVEAIGTESSDPGPFNPDDPNWTFKAIFPQIEFALVSRLGWSDSLHRKWQAPPRWTDVHAPLGYDPAAAHDDAPRCKQAFPGQGQHREPA